MAKKNGNGVSVVNLGAAGPGSIITAAKGASMLKGALTTSGPGGILAAGKGSQSIRKIMKGK